MMNDFDGAPPAVTTFKNSTGLEEQLFAIGLEAKTLPARGGR